MNQLPAITVKNLDFGWSPTAPVLQSCSLEVPQGEFWMLMGDNGSGKSTLLRLIAGLLIPDSGDTMITSPFGFVFQNPDLQLVAHSSCRYCLRFGQRKFISCSNQRKSKRGFRCSQFIRIRKKTDLCS